MRTWHRKKFTPDGEKKFKMVVLADENNMTREHTMRRKAGESVHDASVACRTAAVENCKLSDSSLLV